MKQVIFLTFSFILLLSCNDFLDETPDNRTKIDDAGKIQDLLTGAYLQGNYIPFLEARSDNADDKGPGAFNEDDYNADGYFWKDENRNEGSEDFPEFFWNETYKAIAHANQALASIKELGGGKEFNRYRGEALLTRAYAHFMLVNIWSKTYNPNTASSDLGIPYVTEPENVVFKKYERGTVQEVYDKIEKDLLEGLPLATNNYENIKYHFNIDAANAFASRFYLFKGDWDKVIEHSNRVLGASPTLRDWAGLYSVLTYSETTVRYSEVIEPANLLVTSTSSLFGRRHASLRYQMSVDALRDFYGWNPTQRSWSYPVYGRELSYNIPKFTEYFKVTNQVAGIGLPYVNIVLFSVDEVLLNRIEANTMLTQLEKAKDDINTFLSFKIDNFRLSDTLSVGDISAQFNPDAGSAKLYSPYYEITDMIVPFIHVTLELRQREFYNEGLRWFDNRRFNMEVVHEDFFGNSIVLQGEDLRKQVQIPLQARQQGIKKNPR